MVLDKPWGYCLWMVFDLLSNILLYLWMVILISCSWTCFWMVLKSLDNF